MNRNEIKEAIHKYLKGPKDPYQLFHLSGEYMLLLNRKINRISEDVVISWLREHPDCIRAGTDPWVLVIPTPAR